ncbi:MAG: hypothetical protein HXY47_06720 [Nitrospirae bacterium]|nr:hypothetical protein [Nitrospirota bacterium]
MKKSIKKIPYTISTPPPKKEIVRKIPVNISFLIPLETIALLKNIIIRGDQTTERRQLRREWTESRYPLNINIRPEIIAPVLLAFKSFRNIYVNNPPRKKCRIMILLKAKSKGRIKNRILRG